MRRKNTRKGFTIVELVIVIAVIAILATTLVPTFGNVIQNAKDSAAKQEAKNAFTSYMVANAGKGEMPELFLYKAEEGRVVAIRNGAAVGIYATPEEALTALIGEDYDMNELQPTADGKFFAYGGEVPTPSNPTEPPIQPDEPVSFEGLKVSILGDSISTFNGVNGSTYSVYPATGDVKAVSDTWWQQVIDELGMELLVDNAYGGSRILSDEHFYDDGSIRNYAAYRDRCVNLHKGDEKPDVIFVFMGTNDFSYHADPNCSKCQPMFDCEECVNRSDKNLNVCASCKVASGKNQSFCNQPLGTADSVNLANTENPTSSCEAYAIMLKKMQEAYPNAKIYCLGLLPRVDPYINKGYHDHGQPTAFNAELKKVAENAGATFINLEDCIDNSAATWNNYFADPVHPKAAGMDKISNAVLAAMLNKEVYAVSDELTRATLTGAERVIAGESYTATLAPASGYAELNVKVTMGGVDVTQAVYANGTVNIPVVTGDIVITASGEGIAWTVGAINANTGGFDSSMTSRIVTGYIAVTDDFVVSALGNDAEFCVFYYDSAKNYMKPYDGYTMSSIGVGPSKCAYIRIMARNNKAQGTTLTADYGNNISIAKSIWTVGAIDSSKGTNVDGADWVHRIRTGMIDVSMGVTVSVKNIGSGAQFCPVFYNADGTFAYSPGAYTTETLKVYPGQYAYMRLMVCDYPNKDDKTKQLTPAYGENISIVTGTPDMAWESGTIDTRNGADAASTTRIRSGYIYAYSGVTISAGENAQINVLYYDNNFATDNSKNSGWVSSLTIEKEKHAFIRIVVGYANNSNITADYGENISVTFG